VQDKGSRKLGLNPRLITHLLCDLGEVTLPPCLIFLSYLLLVSCSRCQPLYSVLSLQDLMIILFHLTEEAATVSI
jgi:hypothetical protein